MPRRRPSPSPLLEPPVLIILLPIITLIFLFFLIPPFLSLTSQILRPTISVKKSWDSFNVFLVIFAILCGIFAKKNDDGSPADEDHLQDPVNVAGNNTNIPESESVLPQQWFGYSERNKIYDPPSIRTPESNGGGRLRRSSSSYPDLRQQSLWEDEQTRDEKSRFRFFDDFEINNYRSSSSTIEHRHHTKQSGSKECDDVKEIPVDTFQVLHSSPAPPRSPAPPPPPPPPPTATRHQKTRRTYQTVRRKEKAVEEVNYENEAEVRSPPPTPPPPPPPRPAPPPSPIRIRSEHKRRKSNVKREIAMVWASVLNNQRKRKKKQKVTIRNIYDSAPHDHSPIEQQEHQYYTRPPPSPPPPPPPPPPPSSVFHSLFKKGSKTKKIHSVSPPPPRPPPPMTPPMQKHKSQSTRTTMPPPAPPTPPPPSASRPRASAAGGRPPLPNKANNFYDENVNTGCQSPLIPPAPPPPPFKMPELRFSVRGDFVKIRSTQSSRCGSPELDDADTLAGEEDASKRVNVMDGEYVGGGAGSVFCPSPDVNTKADSFIARLRDEWRLEKMNSMREKKNLGHGPAPKQ